MRMKILKGISICNMSVTNSILLRNGVLHFVTNCNVKPLLIPEIAREVIDIDQRSKSSNNCNEQGTYFIKKDKIKEMVKLSTKL
jgi:hypothetical protein